jgi:hypothetical protein
MSFEMICGQCRGNLLVEHFGVVVACPHCGAHLDIPAPAAPIRVAPAPVAPTPIPPPAPVPVQTIPAPSPSPPAPPSPPPVPQVLAVPAPAPEPPAPPVVTAPAIEPLAPTIVSSTPVTTPPQMNTPAAVLPDATLPAAPPPSADQIPFFGVPISAEPASPATTAFEPSGTVEQPGLVSLSATTVNAPRSESATSEPAPATGGGFSLSGLLASSSPSAEPISLPETTAAPTAAAAAPVAATEVAPSIAESYVAVDAPSAPMSVSGILSHAETSHVDTTTVTTGDLVTFAPATTVKSASKDHVSVSKTAFMMLLSYASAMTLGFVWLLFRLMTMTPAAQDSGLESLPDVAPPRDKKGKQVSFILVPESAKLPKGHELSLGDPPKRFGNINVWVLKVTRGPLRFVHFKDRQKSRFPTSPVLKLSLRFENVSQDQEIAPLDAHLLFARHGEDRFSWRANQFVCVASDKATNKRKVLVYDHVVKGEWDVKGLPLDKVLQPGDSCEYFVPTSENDLEKLNGELIWRVHFRKGYGPKGRGCTTVIEVRFNSKDIQDEPDADKTA